MADRKRILFYVSYLGLGGVATALMRLMRCLERSGYECKVMLPYGTYDQYAFDVVPESYFVGAAWKREPRGRLWRNMLKIFNLLTGWRWYFAFAKRYPHDVFVVYQVLGSAQWARYSEKPTMGWIHGAMSRVDGWRGGLFKFDQRRCLGRFNRLVAVSDQMAGLWQSYFGLAERPEAILNLMDIDELLRKGLEPQAEIMPSARRQIVFLGRLFPEKGLMRLLEALAQLKASEGADFDLWVIGIGREERRARPFVADHRMEDCVHFLGYRANPHPYLHAADLLVVPSYEEGFGLVIWEALIQHCPVLATDAGGCAQALRGGAWGMLVENRDEAIRGGLSAYFKNPASALPKPGFDAVVRDIRLINEENAARVAEAVESVCRKAQVGGRA